MPTWLLVALAFVVTFLETVVVSKQNQSISQYILTQERKYIYHACHWALIFELILTADILLLVNNPKVVTIPILLGAWLGMFYSFNRRAGG